MNGDIFHFNSKKHDSSDISRTRSATAVESADSKKDDDDGGSSSTALLDPKPGDYPPSASEDELHTEDEFQTDKDESGDGSSAGAGTHQSKDTTLVNDLRDVEEDQEFSSMSYSQSNQNNNEDYPSHDEDEKDTENTQLIAGDAVVAGAEDTQHTPPAGEDEKTSLVTVVTETTVEEKKSSNHPMSQKSLNEMYDSLVETMEQVCRFWCCVFALILGLEMMRLFALILFGRSLGVHQEWKPAVLIFFHLLVYGLFGSFLTWKCNASQPRTEIKTSTKVMSSSSSSSLKRNDKSEVQTTTKKTTVTTEVTPSHNGWTFERVWCVQLCVLCVGLLLEAFAVNFAMLSIGFMLAALGTPHWEMISIFVYRMLDPDTADEIILEMNRLYSISLVIGIFISGALMSMFGNRSPFLFAFVFCLIGAITAFAILFGKEHQCIVDMQLFVLKIKERNRDVSQNGGVPANNNNNDDDSGNSGMESLKNGYHTPEPLQSHSYNAGYLAYDAYPLGWLADYKSQIVSNGKGNSEMQQHSADELIQSMSTDEIVCFLAGLFGYTLVFSLIYMIIIWHAPFTKDVVSHSSMVEAALQVAILFSCSLVTIVLMFRVMPRSVATTVDTAPLTPTMTTTTVTTESTRNNGRMHPRNNGDEESQGLLLSNNGNTNNTYGGGSFYNNYVGNLNNELFIAHSSALSKSLWISSIVGSTIVCAVLPMLSRRDKAWVWLCLIMLGVLMAPVMVMFERMASSMLRMNEHRSSTLSGLKVFASALSEGMMCLVIGGCYDNFNVVVYYVCCCIIAFTLIPSLFLIRMLQKDSSLLGYTSLAA